VSNSNVEDVLASVRRLVSDETREAAVPPDPPQNAQGMSPGRLVLTPSFRVMEPDAPDASVLEVPEGPLPSADVIDAVWISAPKTAQVPEAAAPQSAARQEAEVDLLGVPRFLTETGDKPGRINAKTEPSAAPPEPAPTSGVIEHEPPEPEAIQLPGPEPVVEMPPAPSQDHTGPRAEAALDETPTKTVPTSLSDKIAALEAVIGRKSEEFEPDGSEAGDAAYDAVVDQAAFTMAETVQEAVREELVVQTAEIAPASSDAPIPEDPPATALVSAEDGADARALLDPGSDGIDEELLRDMVSEIVRQELQGALGERITRNVRKLVRREIQRALAAHEIE